MGTPFVQVAASFNGFISYKNGMKGAIATQVGLVQFKNFTMADNGGGWVGRVGKWVILTLTLSLPKP